GCETHPIQQAGHFSGFIQGIPYLWRKLDCRRLACRARDVLIFKALGLAGCETHPIQQAGHFSGFIQGFRICGGSWIAGVSPAEHGTCSFLRPLALLDARRIQSSKQAISAEFNKSVQ
ncbi:MAG: hypothetical protein LHW51_04190, partial [Candidatus Cloacimonetes bacterium]|nr:hypothetical protein [Candidatus Cloacimonadota bacterium]MCK9243001.1 hypothetical protein [Candidatus Cloacimonadota bacterium]